MIIITMILLNFSQRLYISFAIVGAIVVLLLTTILLYKNFYVKKRFKFIIGYILYRYSNLNDYLLRNEYRLHIDEKHIGQIDHVLITNKFIVTINDFSISGVISGDAFAEQLKLTTKKGSKMINNPLNYNRNLTKRLAIFNNLDNSYLKGITVVSDDAIINIDNLRSQFRVCRKRDLKKVIKEFEQEDVKPFKEDTVVQFINILDKNSVGE